MELRRSWTGKRKSRLDWVPLIL